jgi:hypothetical protein
MWDKILQYHYEDYKLAPERKSVLLTLCTEFQIGLRDVSRFADALSNDSAFHIAGTEEQNNSPLWHQLRGCRITASRFKDFVTNPLGAAKKVWSAKQDLGHLRSMAWGVDHEPIARLAYIEWTGRSVIEVGLYISKKNPLFGASPDGVLENGLGLLEIKCPLSLKDSDLSLVTKSGHFYTCDNGKLKLRHSHPYFYQVQLQMFVTGATYTDFFI